MPAFGPTLKRYSLRLAATNVPATSAIIVTTLIVRLLITLPKSPVALSAKVPVLWQRTVHSHVKKHGFLLVSLHQRTASFLVVGIGLHILLRILDIFIGSAQMVLILSLRGGSLVGDLLQQLVVIQPSRRSILQGLLRRNCCHVLWRRQRMLTDINPYQNQQRCRRGYHPAGKSPTRRERSGMGPVRSRRTNQPLCS